MPCGKNALCRDSLVENMPSLFKENRKTPCVKKENSISDACTPEPGETVFKTMRYRRNDTSQMSGNFYSKQHDIPPTSNSVTRPTSPTNLSTKYQLPISYGFRDIAHTRF